MVFIIAEAGVNHDGSLENALKLVEVACSAGCNAVKFQTFKAEEVAREDSKMAEYQARSIGSNRSQIDMLKELELSPESFSKIKDYCDKKNIEFMSTPSNKSDLMYLVELGIKRIKIGSSDIDHKELLYYACKTGLPLIISTGMATMGEIRRTVDFINSFPSSGKLTIMQCTSMYPCPEDQINLNVINTFQQEFGEDVGFSDHSEGTLASICAVSKGATFIEKHFTLSKDMTGPDHQASLNPEMLNSFVRQIRSAEILMGSNEKFITLSEASNRSRMRKSLHKDPSGKVLFQRPPLQGQDPWEWEE